ncbi:MAG: ATP-grasp domain-containing protein [Desulfobacteraceae bacterium]|nr:ATP-grasp domain-containing protein [Desulfobacteraceae bacterium]
MTTNKKPFGPIAIGARLIKSPHINTLGLKPNFSDYSKNEKELIISAKKIYFPTAFFADLFNTMGKDTFPSFHTYKFAQDKIRQTAIFKMLNIPHPKTRIFYGKKQKNSILDSFKLPFIAKKARGSSKGRDVYLIDNMDDLSEYLSLNQPAYIQQYIPIDRDIRVVIIGEKVRIAYWRESGGNDFRTNISQGGNIKFDHVPEQALNLALDTAKRCGWNDVGIDIIKDNNNFFIIEANMKYGTQGFKAAGIDYKKMLEKIILLKEV